MEQYLSKIISHFKINPKQLFMLDAVGALLTSFMLLVVLYQFQTLVGIPKETLSVLGRIGLLFCAYSSSCYLFAGRHWRACMKILALANFSYCLFTAGHIFFSHEGVSPLGIAYFCIEIAIILPLVFVEYKTSNVS